MPVLKGSGSPILGLDIGSNYIKVVEAQLRKDRAVVTALGVMPTPTDAVDNNVILDPVGLGAAIKKLLEQTGIKTKKVVSTVASQSSLVVRIIPVPKMTRSELEETMKWEVERHVPFQPSEIIRDFQPLGRPEDVPEGGQMEVLLAVAQDGFVNSTWRRCGRRAGARGDRYPAARALPRLAGPGERGRSHRRRGGDESGRECLGDRTSTAMACSRSRGHCRWRATRSPVRSAT